jgi:hypothetical protein
MGVRRSAVVALIASLVTALAAGCASIGDAFLPTEEVVLKRAQARWDALVERDWNTAYPYMTPGYRAVVPLKRYGNQFSGPAQWESAKAKSAKCEETRCVVNVEITYRLLLPGHMKRVDSTHVEEVWVREEGQWYKFEPL